MPVRTTHCFGGFDDDWSFVLSQHSMEEENEEDDKFPIFICVSEPQKVNEGLQAFVQYKVQTETTLPIFKKKKFSVLRRFSDFLGLHEKLQEKHLHLGRLVPPAPEKSVAGMAKVIAVFICNFFYDFPSVNTYY